LAGEQRHQVVAAVAHLAVEADEHQVRAPARDRRLAISSRLAHQ
jgi:hypothetical protein